MKINIIKSNQRGLSELDWLYSRHSFSFSNYYDSKRIGFGVLKVLNDDIIAPSKGFGSHHHDNFEIVTIVLEGALEHKDSMGNKGIIKANEIQRMSAGTGIMHSEFNPSKKDKVHLLQIWIEPKENNIKPSYEQKNFFKLKINEFTSVVSGIRNNNSVYIHQNAYFSLGNFDADKEINYKLHNVKNGIFLFVIEGEINIENNLLKEGDTAEIQETSKVNFMTKKESKIIIIEVPLGLTTR